MNGSVIKLDATQFLYRSVAFVSAAILLALIFSIDSARAEKLFFKKKTVEIEDCNKDGVEMGLLRRIFWPVTTLTEEEQRKRAQRWAKCNTKNAKKLGLKSRPSNQESIKLFERKDGKLKEIEDSIARDGSLLVDRYVPKGRRRQQALHVKIAASSSASRFPSHYIDLRRNTYPFFIWSKCVSRADYSRFHSTNVRDQEFGTRFHFNVNGTSTASSLKTRKNYSVSSLNDAYRIKSWNLRVEPEDEGAWIPVMVPRLEDYSNLRIERKVFDPSLPDGKILSSSAVVGID